MTGELVDAGMVQRWHQRYAHGGRPAPWWRRADGELVCGICHPPLGAGLVIPPAPAPAIDYPPARAPRGGCPKCGALPWTWAPQGWPWRRCGGPSGCGHVWAPVEVDAYHSAAEPAAARATWSGRAGRAAGAGRPGAAVIPVAAARASVAMSDVGGPAIAAVPAVVARHEIHPASGPAAGPVSTPGKDPSTHQPTHQERSHDS
jgi:hypothetical protein